MTSEIGTSAGESPEADESGHRADHPPAEAATSYRFVVEEDSAGERLDVFLTAQIPATSRVRIRRSIDLGSALIDGGVQKAAYRLVAGETIEFQLAPRAAEGPRPEPIPLDILYEDEAIAVVNKPPRMVVHPARGHWSGTLASALVHHFEELSQHGGSTRPGIVHRLDRDTSGVMVIAKTDEAHQNLAEQFQNRTVEKEYLAIVSGCPDRDRDLIDLAVASHPSQREKMILAEDRSTSRPAQTFYVVEARFRGFALVRAFPKTGRTHQIRLHLNSIRCPVLCDKLYGGRAKLTMGELRSITRAKHLAPDRSAESLVLNRQALHAQILRIRHPLTGNALEFRAELPQDLEQVVLLLQQSNEAR